MIQFIDGVVVRHMGMLKVTSNMQCAKNELNYADFLHMHIPAIETGNWFSCFKQFNSFVLKIWVQILSGNEIAWSFCIKYLWSSLILWHYFWHDSSAWWLKSFEQILLTDRFWDLLQESFQVKLFYCDLFFVCYF